MKKFFLCSLLVAALVGAVIAKNSYFDIGKPINDEFNVANSKEVVNTNGSTELATVEDSTVDNGNIRNFIQDSDVELTIENDSIYPWTFEEDHIVNGNRGKKGTISTLTISFSSDENAEISFDWLRKFYNWHTVILYVDGIDMGSAAQDNYVNKTFCVEKGNHIIMFKDTIENSYSNYDYDISYVKNLSIKKLNKLKVEISTPGSLGDSILARVENFSDVKALRFQVILIMKI